MEPNDRALDMPADPRSLFLTVAHGTWWWLAGRADRQQTDWHASIDVHEFEDCPAELRHVADIWLALAPLDQERDLIDRFPLADWASDFIAEIVVDPIRGDLEPGLEEMLAPGLPRIVFVRHMEVGERWRGSNLAPAMLASALRFFAPDARLAACLLPANDRKQVREPRPIVAARADQALHHLGFRLWKGVHVAGLNNPALVAASTATTVERSSSKQGNRFPVESADR